MDDYIRREEAIDTVLNTYFNTPKINLIGKLFYDAILKLKPADVADVVRCRDCLGKSTWINDPRYGCTVCNMSGMYPKNENGYCSYAIRKGDKK